MTIPVPRTSRPARVVTSRSRGFGLDSPLPADPAIVEAQILRLLSTAEPDLIVVRPARDPEHARPPGHRAVPAFVAGVPDLLLLGRSGKVACLKIKTQAARLSPDQAAFGDLCRQLGIPFAVVRSLNEARSALARFGLSVGER